MCVYVYMYVWCPRRRVARSTATSACRLYIYIYIPGESGASAGSTVAGGSQTVGKSDGRRLERGMRRLNLRSCVHMYA